MATLRFYITQTINKRREVKRETRLTLSEEQRKRRGKIKNEIMTNLVSLTTIDTQLNLWKKSFQEIQNGEATKKSFGFD